jgi:2,5-diketo-D-gluconate reductase B
MTPVIWINQRSPPSTRRSERAAAAKAVGVDHLADGKPLLHNGGLEQSRAAVDRTRAADEAGEAMTSTGDTAASSGGPAAAASGGARASTPPDGDGTLHTGVVEANGARIAALGLGTWDLRRAVCSEMVEHALRLGYRHIDTAEMYGNETEVGAGLRASGVAREEVFITTKVWPDHLAPADLERATKDSLARLRLQAVDLLLIHWPNPRIPLADSIGALCRMRDAGFARNVGVSNFTVPLVEQAVRLATAPLVTNQIEWHPFLDPSKVVAACRRAGLSVTAYSPLARGRAAGNPTLQEIGRRHGKSAGQVSLRFLLQEGAIVIPRTAHRERLKENMEIFDFALDAGEMAQIRLLGRRGGRVVDWSGAPERD